MKLVFLYGPPAVGKLTVARELGQKTGLRVFHNHATVDLLLDVFEFGSPGFVELRERIWLETMEEAAKAGLPGLVFTFAPERTVRPDFIARLRERLEKAGGEVVFVELRAAEEEIERRLDAPSRAGFRKLRSREDYRALRASGAFEFPMPAPALSIDTQRASPKEAAEKIAAFLRNGR